MPHLEKAPPIRVLLADNHPVVREGLRACFAESELLEVVGEAVDGEDAVEQTRKLKPDVVLMDIHMPGMNGFDATRAIVTSGSPTRVLVLTVAYSQDYISEMMRCGAKGYMLKDADPDDLIEAVVKVHNGSLYFIVNDNNSPALPAPPSSPAPHHLLSDREIQVLKRLAEGGTSKDIALETDLAVRTVKTYRERIMRKTGLHTVADIVKYAIAHGLLDASPSPSAAAASQKTAARKTARRKKAA